MSLLSALARLRPGGMGCLALMLGALDAAAASRMVVGAGPGELPEVLVYSGTVGAGPQRVLVFPGSYTGGVRVAAGDVSGDGVADLVAGAGSNSSAVRILDGASGGLLRELTAFEAALAGGVHVALGDVTGDGVLDLIVGAGSTSAQGHVKVFDGRDGALLSAFFAYDAAFAGGVRVAAGDVNGDGRADVIVAPGADRAPLVRVFSGAGATLLHEFMAFDANFEGGVHVAAGDVNGDGRAEVIVGTDAGSSPQVAVFAVGPLRPLGSWSPYASGFQGGVRVATGDLNGDGLADVMTGPGAGMASQINVYSAPGFGAPSSFLAFAPSAISGVSVAFSVRAEALLRDGFE